MTSGKSNENGLKKVCIICSKGTLDFAYPPLMIGTTAASMGAEVHLFFTFYGMNLITKNGIEKLKVSPVGNPAMPTPFPIPSIVSILPGMTPIATEMMKQQIKQSGIASLQELLDAAKQLKVHFHACEPTLALFKLKKEDLIPEVEDVIGVASFLNLAKDSNMTLFV